MGCAAPYAAAVIACIAAPASGLVLNRRGKIASGLVILGYGRPGLQRVLRPLGVGSY